MITLQNYTPYKKRSKLQVMKEALASFIMFVWVWVGLVFALGLSK